MTRQRAIPLILASLLALAPATHASRANADASMDCESKFRIIGQGRYTLELSKPTPVGSLRGGFVVTTNTIEDAWKYFDRLDPILPDSAKAYLDPTFGIYSYWGPLGPVGPLGDGGAVGYVNLWNPSRWITGQKDWTDLSKKLTELGGPLSENGPLGRLGPDGPIADSMLDNGGPLWKHFRQGGVFSPMSRDGFYAARGILGPLGPNGAHGLRAIPGGSYVNKWGKIVRTIKVNDGEHEIRELELVEFYDSQVRKNEPRKYLKKDRSFGVTGNLKPNTTDDYPVFAKGGDYMTIGVVPKTFADRMRIELLSEDGKLIASSDSEKMINFIQLRVPKDTKMRIRVIRDSHSPWNPNPFMPTVFETGSYRLYVQSQPSLESGPAQVTGPQLIRFH